MEWRFGGPSIGKEMPERGVQQEHNSMLQGKIGSSWLAAFQRSFSIDMDNPRPHPTQSSEEPQDLLNNV